MGERSPILDENARGVFFGLSAMHTKADLLRAVLEGVVLSQRHCLDEMQALGVPAPQRITVCGGGATSALWRQITADMLHAEALTVRNPEGPALGAALIAGNRRRGIPLSGGSLPADRPAEGSHPAGCGAVPDLRPGL